MAQLKESVISLDTPVPMRPSLNKAYEKGAESLSASRFNQLLTANNIYQYDEVWYDSTDASFYKKLAVPVSRIQFKETRCSAQFSSFNNVADTAGIISVDKFKNRPTLNAPFLAIKCLPKYTSTTSNITLVALNTRRAVALTLAGNGMRNCYVDVIVPYGTMMYNIPSFDKIWVYCDKEDPLKAKFRPAIVAKGSRVMGGDPTHRYADNRRKADVGIEVNRGTSIAAAKEALVEDGDEGASIKYGHFKEVVQFELGAFDEATWVATVCSGRSFKDSASDKEAANPLATEMAPPSMKLETDVARRSVIVMDADGNVTKTRMIHHPYRKDAKWLIENVDVYLVDGGNYYQLKASDKGEFKCNIAAAFFDADQMVNIGMRMTSRVMLDDVLSKMSDLDLMNVRYHAVTALKELPWTSIKKRLIDNDIIYETNGLENITTDTLRLFDFSSNFDVSDIVGSVSGIIKPHIRHNESESDMWASFCKGWESRVAELVRLPTVAGNWTLFFTTLINTSIYFDGEGLEEFKRLAKYVESITVHDSCFDVVLDQLAQFLRSCFTAAMKKRRTDLPLDIYCKNLTESLLLNECVKHSIRRFVYEDAPEERYLSLDGLSLYLLNFLLENTFY